MTGCLATFPSRRPASGCRIAGCEADAPYGDANWIFRTRGLRPHLRWSATGTKAVRKVTARAGMNRCLKQGRWRKIAIKPVVGQINHAPGFRRFLPGGLGKARHVRAINRLAHDLSKPVSTRGRRCRAEPSKDRSTRARKSPDSVRSIQNRQELPTKMTPITAQPPASETAKA